MKKRQKPILLITLLGVMVAGAIAMNYMTDPTRKVEQPDSQMLGESRSSDEHKDFGATAASKLQQKREPSPKMKASTGILNPEVVRGPMKPKPSDTAVSSQWYANEHSK